MSGKISNSRPPCGARKPRKIRDGVFYVGAADWDRALFDALIPLPDGTSYNAYLVQGDDKTVLIDTVDPALEGVLLERLQGIEKIDYVVSLHAEQDHSGTLPVVLERYPQAQLVVSKKARDMLADLLPLAPERFLVVEDGQQLPLGGRTLKFIYTPWVHWPETMSALLEEEGVLFSCDFFGSHIASSELFVGDQGRVYEAAKRYFAEIMMPFRTVIAKNIEKLSAYDIKMIAPSHGAIHRQPQFIVDAYRQWVSGPPANRVVLAHVSMHGSTQLLVDRLAEGLVERGVEVEKFDLPVTDIGKLAMSLVDAATIVIGTPTVLAGPHPAAAYAAFLANALRPPARFLSIIGSYGWGGRTVEMLSAMVPNIKAEVLEPVLCRGLPGPEDLQRVDGLAEAIVAGHRREGLPAGG